MINSLFFNCLERRRKKKSTDNTHIYQHWLVSVVNRKYQTNVQKRDFQRQMPLSEIRLLAPNNSGSMLFFFKMVTIEYMGILMRNRRLGQHVFFKTKLLMRISFSKEIGILVSPILWNWHLQNMRIIQSGDSEEWGTLICVFGMTSAFEIVTQIGIIMLLDSLVNPSLQWPLNDHQFLLQTAFCIGNIKKEEKYSVRTTMGVAKFKYLWFNFNLFMFPTKHYKLIINIVEILIGNRGVY